MQGLFITWSFQDTTLIPSWNLTTFAAVFWRICYWLFAVEAAITSEKGKATEQSSISLPELSVSTAILQSVDTVRSTGFNISWNRYFISIEVKSQTLHLIVHNVRQVLICFRRKTTLSGRMYLEMWNRRYYVTGKVVGFVTLLGYSNHRIMVDIYFRWE
jgi:hypothetical protein